MGVNGKIFDNQILRVFVPSDWKHFYGIDSDGKASPKKLHIYKNAQTEFDIFSKAGITICFYGKDEIFLSPRFFYDDARDIEPFESGGKLWNGFTCTSFGYPYTMLYTKHNDATFQVMVLTKNGEHEISLDDIDVKAILESISQSES